MATENNRKILYIGGGIISLLIVTVITILWICLREPALVLSKSSFCTKIISILFKLKNSFFHCLCVTRLFKFKNKFT